MLGVQHYIGGSSSKDFLIFSHVESKKKNNLMWNVSTKRGGIVEMAIDENAAKIINGDHLAEIRTALLYHHPEFMSFYKLYDKGFVRGSDLVYLLDFGGTNYHDKFIDQAFRETFNCELDDALEQIKADFESDYGDLSEQEQDNFKIIFHSYKEGSFKNNFLPYSIKRDELMKADQHKPHLVDKMWAVYRDSSLRARLLGYDAIAVEKKASLRPSRADSVGGNDYKIVNPGIITVCTEAGEDDYRGDPCTLEKFAQVFDKYFETQKKNGGSMFG